MNLYAETSAVLRWLLGAPDAPAIAASLGRAETVFSSRLTLIEVERVLARELGSGNISPAQAEDAHRRFGRAVSQWRIVAVIDEVCVRAGREFPVEPVRTLDALHLATALFAARLDPGLALLTTDRRIIANAERLGLGLALAP